MSWGDRTQTSKEQRLQDVLGALGNSTATVTELGHILEGTTGWERGRFGPYGDQCPDLLGPGLWQLVYGALETLRLMGEVEREPTGKGRPRWRYFKTTRPLHGPIADLDKQFAA